MSPTIMITPTMPQTYTAVFEVAPIPPIVINELHYNPSPDQGDDAVYEFLELYNAGSEPVDLTDFAITDGIVYTFTAGTVISPDEYIVLAQTAATYAGNGYQVFQWVSGSLSNGGETVELSDPNGVQVDVVDYSDDAPWPTDPDSEGPSLSLIHWSLDNNVFTSWFASFEFGGTPGAINWDPPPTGVGLVSAELQNDLPSSAPILLLLIASVILVTIRVAILRQ